MARPGSRSAADIAPAIEEAAGHFRQGRLDDAEKACSRIIKNWPDCFDALHLLGVVRLQRGKAAAALALLEKALKINPASVQALCNLALCLSTLNRNAEALAVLDKALGLAPQSIGTLGNRGTVLLKLGRAVEALAVLDQVVAVEPRHLGARINRGNALAQLGRLQEAVAEYDVVLAAFPGHAETHVNRGNALSRLGRPADAIAAFERALAIRPDYVNALIGCGSALQALNRHREAIERFEQVLAIDRDNADARHNQALSLLTLGDYRRGFERYEWRWRRSGMPDKRRSFGKPLWLGEYPLTRKTIVLHAEQGLGDVIQFVRYAPVLARSGARVVLEVQPELKSLVSRVAGVAEVVARSEPLPAYDVHCPLGSLPHALRTEASSIPADVPYLKPSGERVAKWRAQLETIASPRIGIAWAGNVAHPNDRNRSIPFASLAPLFSLDGVQFVSLQRDLRGDDKGLMERMPGLTHIGDALEDFDDTAAAITLLDAVISVDTAVAHLAGTLARPTWVLLPFQPDWRWLLEREDCPWYPTVRLFRQPSPGDWGSVLARVREGLSRR